jgi:uncharacterized protein YgfB (UPF0149 family)
MNRHYTEIQQVLTGERALADVAEAHGTLAGCLCAAPGYQFQDWLQEILPEGEAQPQARQALRDVFDASAQSLEALEGPDTSVAFQLLLPEDSAPIEARATALGQWCQGFLYGLGSSGAQDARSWSGQVGEIVRDLTEITHVGVDGEESEDSNESAYAELVEFVRAAVQLVFIDLHERLRDRHAPPPGPALH